MTEKPTRRRRLLLVPLLGMGVAAWVARSGLVERRPLREGWPPLPPRPGRPAEAGPQAPLREGAVDAADAQLASVEPEPAPARARAVPAAAAVASVAAPALPTAPFGPGSVRANDDGAAPAAEYGVKGKTATRVFYAPGSPYYSRTRADVWFRTDDDARAAGFTPRAPRRSS